MSWWLQHLPSWMYTAGKIDCKCFNHLAALTTACLYAGILLEPVLKHA
jgi:hypothetical protein